jgi:hypothetical protein
VCESVKTVLLLMYCVFVLSKALFDEFDSFILASTR